MAQRLIVPLDRTKHSEVALNALHDLCQEGDEVFLLSIDGPAMPIQAGTRPGRIIEIGITGSGGGGVTYTSPFDVPSYTETMDQSIQRQLDEMQDYLLDKAGALEKAGFKVQVIVEISEHPVEAIVTLAKRIRPTYILMVRSTHHSVGQRIFGTVPQNVIRENIAPVMVLPVLDEAVG